MEKARNLWPEAIKGLPMNEQHKLKLKDHWGKLNEDFQIN
jgi:serine/threonine-protein kinase HipA